MGWVLDRDKENQSDAQPRLVVAPALRIREGFEITGKDKVQRYFPLRTSIMYLVCRTLFKCTTPGRKTRL